MLNQIRVNWRILCSNGCNRRDYERGLSDCWTRGVCRSTIIIPWGRNVTCCKSRSNVNASRGIFPQLAISDRFPVKNVPSDRGRVKTITRPCYSPWSPFQRSRPHSCFRVLTQIWLFHEEVSSGQMTRLRTDRFSSTVQTYANLANIGAHKFGTLSQVITTGGPGGRFFQAGMLPGRGGNRRYGNGPRCSKKFKCERSATGHQTAEITARHAYWLLTPPAYRRIFNEFWAAAFAAFSLCGPFVVFHLPKLYFRGRECGPKLVTRRVTLGRLTSVYFHIKN